MLGAPSSGTPRESQVKFKDGTVWGPADRGQALAPGGFAL